MVGFGTNVVPRSENSKKPGIIIRISNILNEEYSWKGESVVENACADILEQ